MSNAIRICGARNKKDRSSASDTMNKVKVKMDGATNFKCTMRNSSILALHNSCTLPCAGVASCILSHRTFRTGADAELPAGLAENTQVHTVRLGGLEDATAFATAIAKSLEANTCARIQTRTCFTLILLAKSTILSLSWTKPFTIDAAIPDGKIGNWTMCQEVGAWRMFVWHVGDESWKWWLSNAYDPGVETCYWWWGCNY